jgi:hypothetical protein
MGLSFSSRNSTHTVPPAPPSKFNSSRLPAKVIGRGDDLAACVVRLAETKPSSVESPVDAAQILGRCRIDEAVVIAVLAK